MQPGEIWWVDGVPESLVVLLTAGDPAEAMHVVAPASDEQKRGFIVLTPEEATDDHVRAQALAQPVGGVGIEVPVGDLGVVRVALPRDGRIFCTWQLTVQRSALVRRAGVLSPERMRQLGSVVELAGIIG
ncbi:hypothetical protein [Actinoplanes sp. HUAS TT8]|uniref:hypothetical protein n=1 Tax=Actinoplanes sp. HUAS TT8 TaxID=3447453 RepID=UPI003F520D86